MATSFTVNKADLEFILRQIKIAEATSLGYTPAVAPLSIQQAIMEAYGLSASDAAIAPFGLRTVDGSFNSLVSGQGALGGADVVFPRLTDPVYRNEGDDQMPLGPPGSGAPTITNNNYGTGGSVADADPRIISNLIVDMSVTNPAAITAYLGNPLSLAQFETDHPGRIPVAPGALSDPPVAAELEITNADLLTIPNLSPDIGLSPGFNSWMTFFGQFFDHGLDLVVKGGNGTVYVPLQQDDPLFNKGADGIAGNADDGPNFMALTRATPTMVNGVAQHTNTTTSFVDQNQTYTSHSSHQVFLREYATVDGKTVSTGRLLDGSTASGSVNGAIGNWGEVKAQALQYLGINLNDFDVLNVPLLLTDQYGKFIAGPNGFAQIVMAPDADHATVWYKEGMLDGSVTTAGSLKTGHAFLDDIAHHAAPGTWDHDNNPATAKVAQTADTLAGVADDGLAGTYDDEMLNAHFVTGDGRGNENAALTTVHSIFHSEHNRLVDANKATILASGDLAFINEWLLTDVAAVPAANATLNWDGERLFQAARFGTEMQYQHMVFEEFARRIQPMVDPFIFNTSPDVDPAITAEFAHTVYRFGHSMLTGTVDRLENDLTAIDEGLNTNPDQKALLAMFLNPQAYIGSGATLEEINANIVRGLSRDTGNSIDEFIVTDVRSNLLGLPLDLAALNIARGRDTGIPSLNQTRAQLYNDTGFADLKPYTSWTDFALNIKHAASIVNFIAAYGTHSTITSATTLADKRAAAEELVFGVDGSDVDTSVASDRIAFLNATGSYSGDKGGLEFVDLWIGGLAEKSPEFGGMLGVTFNYVFEATMENLQNGDRMYYLTRTQGTNFLNQLEPNSFADMVMRNTDLGDIYSTHINGQLFVTPDHIIELDRGIAQTDYNGEDDPATLAIEGEGRDPGWDGSNPTLEAILGPKVVRDYTGSTVVDGTHDFGGYLRVQGGEHYVLGGTEGNDRIYGDSGIDTLWGDGGNDYLNGMTESDDVFGGTGDDVIEDPFGDDVLRGEQGNDVITTARGADLVFGGEGQDYVILGQDASEVFGGTDTDFILGGNGKDFLLGNEGDDWVEGGGGFDTIAGENSELFFNSPIIGHDVLFGHGDETDYDAESGDDIMGSGPSVYRYEGMFGFDWGIAKNDHSAIKFDLQIPIFTTIPEDTLRDRFDQTEALSGWKNDDTLEGDDRGHSGGSSSPDSVPTQLFTDHLLTAEGIDRITGLRQMLGGTANVADPIKGIETLFGAGKTTFRDGNILVGGDGNDHLRGRGGYDILDGDAWLNVRIKIVHNGVTYSAESLTTDTIVAGPNAGKVFNTNADGSPNFASVAFDGRSLNSLVLDRTINPGEMSIVREILDGTLAGETDTDTAMFQGGNLEYEIEGTTIQYNADGVATGRTGTIADTNGDGFIRVKDLDDGLVAAPGRVGGLTVSRGALTDDTDLLKNIERLQFADGTINIGGSNRLATGSVTISDPTPFDHDNNPATPGVISPIVGQVLTAKANIQDLDGLGTIDPITGLPPGGTFEWQTTEAGNDGGWATISSGLTYTVRSVDPSHVLRAVAVFNDNLGVTERIASGQTDNVTAPFSVNENVPTNTLIAPVPFSLDYDPLGFGGTGVTDGDVVQLTHIMAPGQDAGGRFKIVNTGSAAAPVYQLAVANGALLDYEAVQTPVDNQYQIVIHTYTDTIANGGVLMAARQFTVLINDVFEVVVVNSPATGQPLISDVTPTEGQTITASTLGIVDANGLPGTFNYQWQYSENNGATWNNTGTNNAAFTPTDARVNDILRVVVSYTDLQGFAEVVTSASSGPVGDLISGPLFGGTVTGTPWDDNLVALGGNNTINGNAGSDIINGGSLLGNDNLNGGAGNDTVNGNGGADAINGGADNDTINGGAGNDTITQLSTDGRDIVDGAGGTDTYQLNGVAGAEVFRIYTRAAALAGPDAITGLTAAMLNSNTEIVVTRTTGEAVTAASIIAELDNIEEINVNTLGVTANNNNGGLDGGSTGGPPNGDTVQIIGNFGTATNAITSLNFSTITIDGNAGDDTVDISALTSAHRIVFKSNGGNDTIIGDLRPQDVIDLPDGATAADYTTTTDANGVSTMTNGTHSVTFTAPDGMPQVGGDDDHDDDDDDEDDDDHHNGSDDGDDDDDDDDGCGCDDDDDEMGTPAPSPSGNGSTKVGTANGDTLLGTAAADNLIGFAGDDVLIGEGGDDAISAGEGADFINAGDGEDAIQAGAGDDTVFAGADADLIHGEAGADRIFGQGGDDVIFAGAGNDTVVGGAGNDLLVGELYDDHDVYFGDDVDGGNGNDTLDLSAITANLTVDLGNGVLGRGSAVSNQSGADTLWSIENVVTGFGDDTITASAAVNVMEGGTGNDTFRFLDAAGADGDTILDFEPGDRLDVSGIDADAGAGGNQAFTLIPGQAFTASGQLMVTYETREGVDYTIVSGNVGGSLEEDFQVELKGSHNLTGANFTL